MNPMMVVAYRIFQKVYHYVLYLLPFPKPQVVKGPGVVQQVGAILAKEQLTHVMVVTDQGIVKLGLHYDLLESLAMSQITYTVFDGVVANPTIDNIETALAIYLAEGCEGLVALGGGSVMDCAKAVGARVVRPHKTITQLKGYLRVRRRLPLLMAIPTTAGTGSETTVAAVIVDAKTNEKYAINDLSLVPRYAILDPMLSVGLPQGLTATTGMDALTHAIEAYLGNSNTAQTIKDSERAVQLIYQYLPVVYDNGLDVEAREWMLEASFLAGAAFTRAFVGYVHTIAHTLGGQYNLPHGYANAVILPLVLTAYGQSATKKLARLARLVNLPGDDDQQLAQSMIDSVKAMNWQFGIPEHLPQIQTQDIELLALRSLHEAHPMYPVPRFFTKLEMQAIYQELQ